MPVFLHIGFTIANLFFGGSVDVIGTLIIQLVVSSILLGGIYAAVSVGLTLVFGVMRVVNFAHGEFLMLAMFAAYFLVQGTGMDVYASMLITAPCFFLAGVLVYMVLIKPIIHASSTAQIFVTLGLSTVLQNVALIAFGGDYRGVETAVGSMSVNIGGVAVSVSRLIAFAITVSLVVLLLLFMKYTYIGRAISAAAQDSDAAKIVGINLKLIYSLAFGIATMLIAIVASAILPIYGVSTISGVSFQLLAFVIVVIGGLGNIRGAFFGGILIGFVEIFSGYFLSIAFKEAIYFIIFIIVLWIKPAGLFGKRGFEQVGTR